MEHVHHYGEIITEQASCGNNQRLIRKCSICGAIEVIGVQSNVLKHHFADQKTLQQSTCMKPGRSEYTCVRCGYTKQVTLPLSGHHYVKNNPFYQECRDCRKKALTPFAKRTLLISGTSALVGGGICFALQRQQSFPADTEVQKTTTAVMNTIEIGSVETSSETELSPTETSEIKITLPETTVTETASNETPLPEITACETMISETGSYDTQAPETTAYETQAPETAAYKHEDFTTLASETERFTTTVPETEGFTTSAVETNQFEPTASETVPSTAAATKAEISESAAVETVTPTAPVTEALQTASVDYTALTGEILNGSDLLNLIEEGAPLEIITNTGTRFCANISISGAYPLFDTALIPTSASYTVNVILSEQQQVIVCNQF
jgi:hypothetical protein